jgi:16S rRNA G966 N2-methylase RsmD
MRFLAKWLVPRPFDLIFADPPYGNRPPREKAAGGVPCVVELLGRIAEGERLAGGGWVVVEDAAGGEPVVPAGWELLKDRTYGGTRLSFYVRARGAAARQESNE